MLGVASEDYFKLDGFELLTKIKENNELLLQTIDNIIEGKPVEDNFVKKQIPKITISCPVYNGDKYIKHFLEDITKQTIFANCELIIINANSPGNEESVITQYCNKYNNIIYKRLDYRATTTETINMVISELSTGEYITVGNRDDCRRYDCLENQAREEGPALTPPVQPQPSAPPLSSVARQPEAPAPLPPPTPPVAVAPGLRQRPASPIESRFIQQYPGMTQPVGEGRVSRQTMFDPFTGELITTSNDVLTGLDDILRKMERVQALDAMQDDSVRKLLPSDKVSINSFWDVQRVAKSLGITSVDVHGLYQSTGDWYKVADQWNVKPDVVKAVKIAFGGV